MKIYEIPRNYKGEGRILYIFSTKALIYTSVGIGIGLIFYLIFKMIGLTTIGTIITVIFGGIGFIIGTLKIPENNNIDLFKKTGGENIDDVILRWIKFKMNKNKVYIYKEKEVTKDE